MTRSEIRENMLVALDTLRARKVRSVLTILGIVIGVTSVIAVAAIIDGLNGFMINRIKSFGSRSLFITRIPAGYTGGRLPHRILMRKYLDISDARYLKDTVPGLDISTAFLQRIDIGNTPPDSIRYADEHVERLIIRGCQPDYAAAIALFTVASGRFISQYDEEHARNVVVIGAAIASTLFPHTDPIGKTVRLDGQLYDVIGVFEKDEGVFGLGVDQFAVIPLSNFHKNFPGVRDVFLIFTVREDADIKTVQDLVTEAMRRHRHVPYNAENDFDIADSNFFLSLWNQLTGAMALLTGVIGSIGLLVGGIGVMNIMLISVTERTGEIGIRKAIGARRSDIRAQFLLEAITLSGIGGVLGVIVGGLIAFAVRALVSLPATLSPFWVIMGVAISVGVGLFFGFYPANRAAHLDPIVCLRYE